MIKILGRLIAVLLLALIKVLTVGISGFRSPNNFASNQFTDSGGATRDKFDYSQSCIGYGYFIPFTKFMIMTYSDHTTSFDNPGATAYYSRSSRLWYSKGFS